MSFNKNISSAYANADHRLGRLGTAAAATATGAGVGAGVGFVAKANPITGAAVGAAVGFVGEEAGRLFVDETEYEVKRLELSMRDTIKVAAKYF
jgi:hypothetical protein